MRNELEEIRENQIRNRNSGSSGLEIIQGTQGESLELLRLNGACSVKRFKRNYCFK